MPSSCKTIAPEAPQNLPHPLRSKTKKETGLRRGKVSWADDVHVQRRKSYEQAHAWRRGLGSTVRPPLRSMPPNTPKSPGLRCRIASKGDSAATKDPTPDLVEDDATSPKRLTPSSCQQRPLDETGGEQQSAALPPVSAEGASASLSTSTVFDPCSKQEPVGEERGCKRSSSSGWMVREGRWIPPSSAVSTTIR